MRVMQGGSGSRGDALPKEDFPGSYAQVCAMQLLFVPNSNCTRHLSWPNPDDLLYILKLSNHGWTL